MTARNVLEEPLVDQLQSLINNSLLLVQGLIGSIGPLALAIGELLRIRPGRRRLAVIRPRLPPPRGCELRQAFGWFTFCRDPASGRAPDL